MIAIAAMVDKLMNSRIDGGGILLRSLCVYITHFNRSAPQEVARKAKSCKKSEYVRVCLRPGFTSPGRAFAALSEQFPILIQHRLRLAGPWLQPVIYALNTR
jgi:hypothetical protein